MQGIYSFFSALVLTTFLALIVFKLDVDQIKSDVSINTEELELQDSKDDQLEEIQFQLKDLNSFETSSRSNVDLSSNLISYHFAIKSHIQIIHSPPPEA